MAVLLGAAMTSAVLTGSLLVGDSVRGSLRDLTLERLGRIDYAFLSGRFFRGESAAGLKDGPGISEAFDEIVPAILLAGTATHGNSSLRASGVNIQGIDERFPELFGLPPETLEGFFSGSSNTGGLPPAVINSTLADELQAKIGDSVLFSFGNKEAVNPEFLLGSRDSQDLLRTLRAKVVEIWPDSSMGRFSLQLHQGSPRNAFLPLRALQGTTDRQGKVNSLLISGSEDLEFDVVQPFFKRGLSTSLELEDYGLTLRTSGTDAVLESREMVISPIIEKAVRQAAQELRVDAIPVMTYLANTMESDSGSIPYSTVTALDVAQKELGVPYAPTRGESADGLQIDEILLNEWAARQLEVRTGDIVTLTYYVVDWQEALSTRKATFKLKGVVPLEGLALDQTLTPAIPGVEDARNMASWNPPVPIDLSRIRPVDEAYWESYRTAPKAFISYAAGVSLWESRFGRLTSFRFDLEHASAQEIETQLLKVLDPDLIGTLLPVKQTGLEAASGATDFGMLFIGFSFFLITSAVLLVALLFRLGVEYRASEIGILLAIGFPASRVRRTFLGEGALLAIVGSSLGLLGGLAYGALLILGLRTLWVAAVGTTFLDLHATWTSLAAGFFISLAAILGSIAFTFRDLAKLPLISLLAGVTSRVTGGAEGWAKWFLTGSTTASAVILGLAFFTSSGASPALFFGLGASFLVMGLSVVSIGMHKGSLLQLSPRARLLDLRTAVRNAARNSGRSLLSMVLVSCASFVIVAVGANRSHPGNEIWERESGAGGFAIRAESDLPLVRDLNGSEALFDLGFSDQEIEELQGANVIPYRLLPGEDMSCRNLYQPRRPRILGVPDSQIARGGFRFQETQFEAENPWSLLHKDLGPEVVPAFGDASSVLWILHRGLGDDIAVQSERGEQISLRLVGLLSHSLFQSELLISEENFQRHFPDRSGFSYFLIETAPEKADRVSEVLENRLSRFGFDAAPSSQVLESFIAIQNTYLGTFQTLGGFGLLLGTLGLAIVLVRNTNERRGELATLRAFGYPEKRISRLIFLEHLFLLMMGILLGTASALLSVAPHLIRSSGDLPWISLSLTLLVVLAVGALATTVSVRLAFKRALLSELRQE